MIASIYRGRIAVAFCADGIESIRIIDRFEQCSQLESRVNHPKLLSLASKIVAQRIGADAIETMESSIVYALEGDDDVADILSIEIIYYKRYANCLYSLGAIISHDHQCQVLSELESLRTRLQPNTMIAKVELKNYCGYIRDIIKRSVMPALGASMLDYSSLFALHDTGPLESLAGTSFFVTMPYFSLVNMNNRRHDFSDMVRSLIERSARHGQKI